MTLYDPNASKCKRRHLNLTPVVLVLSTNVETDTNTRAGYFDIRYHNGNGSKRATNGGRCHVALKHGSPVFQQFMLAISNLITQWSDVLQYCQIQSALIKLVHITEHNGASSSAFPSYISGVHHFWVGFLRMWTFFNPTIKVVTFRLRGWCVLGVFLLPAFTRLGHERQDLLSPCDEMHVCTD